MKPNKVRPVAICVFRDGERIFVEEGYDPVKDQTFYRPLGGAIKFGERGDQTVARELLEEIAAEVKNVRYLGMLQNIFTYNGLAGHEIVLVYDGEFADRTMYEKEHVDGHEGDGSHFNSMWKRLDEFADGAPLHPDGLMELLAEK